MALRGTRGKLCEHCYALRLNLPTINYKVILVNVTHTIKYSSPPLLSSQFNARVRGEAGNKAK